MVRLYPIRDRCGRSSYVCAIVSWHLTLRVVIHWTRTILHDIGGKLVGWRGE
jgi:hypothetical protein